MAEAAHDPDVQGPVQAEIFVVWLDGDRIALTGPDGPQPWLLQLGPTEHPEVSRIFVKPQSGSTRAQRTRSAPAASA